MMEKLKVVAFSLFILSGCASLSSALVEPVILPNGSQGLTVNCTAYGWSACFKAAGESCKSGYAIHERSMEENTKSELPTEPLADKSESHVRGPAVNLPDNKEKYMVISCK